MNKIEIYGASISPYVRAARVAFHEAHVAVEYHDIGFDHLATAGFVRINPFRKMPALVHGTFNLYETAALMVYAEAVGSGLTLEPAAPKERARMWQYIGVAQSQLYPVGVMQLSLHTFLAPLFGMEPDREVANAAAVAIEPQLDVLEQALEGPYLAGGSLSHADLICGAMVDYVARTSTGQALLSKRPKVDSWLCALRARESFQATLAPVLAS